MKILMVCLGNICRSPLAEGIAQNLIHHKKLDWIVDSAGTTGWHEGSSPDKRSIAVAKDHDIDISGLRARQIRQAELPDWDLIVAMDAQNYQDIRRLDPEVTGTRLHMMMNFLYPGQNRPVPDPYYGSKKDFEEVYTMLYQACEAMLEELTSAR
ncbi:MAG: low molecular weight phosphotyrosine protein phosphatase [Saprospiraceae bacterium]|nr:low molecular weight phosphotyrosine protein phosphatase [Saprospiraceae bacterium]